MLYNPWFYLYRFLSSCCKILDLICFMNSSQLYCREISLSYPILLFLFYSVHAILSYSILFYPILLFLFYSVHVIISYFILFYPILLFLFYSVHAIISYSILSYSILFHPILLYSILSYSILFYSFVFNLTLFHPIIFCPILFYPILFHPISFYPSLFYLILFQIILFYHILSWLSTASFVLAYSNINLCMCILYNIVPILAISLNSGSDRFKGTVYVIKVSLQFWFTKCSHY